MVATVRQAAFGVGLAILAAAAAPRAAAQLAPMPQALAGTSPSQSDASVSDQDFDARFQCPETLTDDDMRRSALVGFFHWAAARHPDWSIADTVEFRKAMLERHSCTATLKAIADYTKRER